MLCRNFFIVLCFSVINSLSAAAGYLERVNSTIVDQPPQIETRTRFDLNPIQSGNLVAPLCPGVLGKIIEMGQVRKARVAVNTSDLTPLESAVGSRVLIEKLSTLETFRPAYSVFRYVSSALEGHVAFGPIIHRWYNPPLKEVARVIPEMLVSKMRRFRDRQTGEIKFGFTTTKPIRGTLKLIEKDNNGGATLVLLLSNGSIIRIEFKLNTDLILFRDLGKS